MTMRKLPQDAKPTTVVANDPEDRKGTLTAGTIRLPIRRCRRSGVKKSDSAQWDRLSATVAALVGISPKDELEGMMAAQLLAAHNAAMECYRRAMLGEQTFEGRRDNLNQATKLSRTWATLLDALNRHRGKGQQRVTDLALVP